MDVRIMEYMLMIEQEKHLSRAASKLNISQPALSQALSKLEQSFQAPLFVRANRQMIPTKIGRIYLDGAREMLQVKEDTYQALKAMTAGDARQIRIAADALAILPLEKELLPAFHHAFPHKDLSIFPADSHIAKTYIINHIADAAFIASRFTSNSMLRYHHLYDENLMLCIPENLLGQYEDDRKKNASIRIPFIFPQSGLYFRIFYDNILEKLSFSISKSYEAENFLTIKHLMEQGFGAALLPGRMVRMAKGYAVRSISADTSFSVYFSIPQYHDETAEFDYILKKAKEIFSRN